MIRLFLYGLVFFLIWTGVTKGAEWEFKGEAPVQMEADELSYEQAAEAITMQGSVRITYKGMTVEADKVVYYDKTKDVVAEGRVVLREGEDVLRCDRLELNIETKRGAVYNGQLFLKKKNFHITGSKAEKLGESEYRVFDATLTSCDERIPPWMFTARQLDVTIEGYARGWWPGFRVLNVPILYFPWAIFPVKTERQSGFLFPEFGSSSKWGPEVMIPFYWAIAPNQDATFYFERIGDKRGRGFKEGIEYRYALSSRAQGQLRGNYIWDERGDRSDWWEHKDDKSRWSIFADHDQRLGNGYYLKADVNWVSDQDYPVDFASDIPAQTRIDASSLNLLASRTMGGKDWSWGALETDATYYRDLTVRDNDATMQILPATTFSVYQNRLFTTPIFYELAAEGTNLWREEGIRGGWIELYPRLSIPIKPLDIVRLDAWIGYRETIYIPEDDPRGSYDEATSREIFDAGASISTTLSRVFPLEWGRMRGLRHVVEPKVIYTYIPKVDQEENPDFHLRKSDYVIHTDNPAFCSHIDRITRENTVTWILTNYLIGKELKRNGSVTYPEYLYIKIYQGYNTSSHLLRDGRHHLSNLALEARIAPFDWLGGGMDLEYNPHHNRLDAMNAGLRFADNRGDHLGLQYRFTKGIVEEANAELGVRVLEPLDLYFAYRHNLRDRVRIESVYGIDYRHQCWEVSLRVHDINRQPDPSERSELKVMVWVTLKGLGRYRVR